MINLCLKMITPLLLGVGFAFASMPVSAGGYHLEQKIVLGGKGGWDYLTFDSSTQHLYVTHADRTLILDTQTATIVGEIPGVGVHGVAIATDLKRGFVTNGRGGTATIFDLGTLKPLTQVPTGSDPDAILYEPSTHRVFTFNGKSKDATIFDGASGKVLSTLPLGGKPEFAVTDAQGHIYVNIEDTSELVTLDAQELKVTDRHSLAPCTEPTGLALDVVHQRLFAVCSNKIMAVVNAQTGKVITTLTTGAGTDAVAYDPNLALVYSSNGEGTLTVIHADTPDQYRVVENVRTQKGARTLALDPKTHRIYLATAQFDPRPLPTPEQPNPRPSIVEGSFELLVFKP